MFITHRRPAAALTATAVLAAGLAAAAIPVTAGPAAAADERVSWTDAFDGAALDARWDVVNPDPAHLSVSDGALRIAGQPGDTYQSGQHREEHRGPRRPGRATSPPPPTSPPRWRRSTRAPASSPGRTWTTTSAPASPSSAGSHPRARPSRPTSRAARPSAPSASPTARPPAPSGCAWRGSATRSPPASGTGPPGSPPAPPPSPSTPPRSASTPSRPRTAPSSRRPSTPSPSSTQPGADVTPSGPFVLQADGDAPYLVADGNALALSDQQPTASLRLRADRPRRRRGRARPPTTPRSCSATAPSSWAPPATSPPRCASPTPAAARSCCATPPTRRRTSSWATAARSSPAPRPTRSASSLSEVDEGTSTLSIDGDGTGASISDDMFGIFYEDINYAADGGLYAELVRNRSFEFNTSDNGSFTGLTAWQVLDRSGAGTNGTVVDDATRLNAMNRNHLRLNAAAAGDGVRNIGYNNGFAVKAGATYEGYLWARSTTAQPLTVRLENAAGDATVASATVALDGSDTWRKYPFTLSPGHDHRRRSPRRPGRCAVRDRPRHGLRDADRPLGRTGQREVRPPQGPRREDRGDEPGLPPVPRRLRHQRRHLQAPTRRAASPTGAAPTSGRRPSARSRSARPTGTSGATTRPTASATWSTSSSPRTSTPSRCRSSRSAPTAAAARASRRCTTPS